MSGDNKDEKQPLISGADDEPFAALADRKCSKCQQSRCQCAKSPAASMSPNSTSSASSDVKETKKDAKDGDDGLARSISMALTSPIKDKCAKCQTTPCQCDRVISMPTGATKPAEAKPFVTPVPDKPPADGLRQKKPAKSAGGAWLQPRRACAVSVVAIMIFVPLLYIVVKDELPNRGVSLENNSNILASIGSICLHRRQDGVVHKERMFMFSIMNVKTNDTSLIYIDVDRNVQVTNIVRQGTIMYTEIIDFDRRQVAVYPNGRLDGSQPCSLHDVTNEKNWIDIACMSNTRVFFEVSQMDLMTAAEPIDMTSTFFDLPAVCTPSGHLEDMTRIPDRIQLLALQRWRDNLENTTLLPDALRDLLDLIAIDFSASEIEDEALLTRLTSAYARMATDYFRLGLDTVLRGPDGPHHNSSACCFSSDLCEQILAEHPNGLGLQCQTYQRCVVQQEGEWAKLLPGQTPGTSCRAGERRCHCDYALVTSLQTPGMTQCGNCMDDLRNCECYVMSWLIRYLASRRPCWCAGICSRQPFSYVCQTSTKCSGWFSDVCDTVVEWCPRVERFRCTRCDSPHMDDKDDHC